jgi:hypothetical protein
MSEPIESADQPAASKPVSELVRKTADEVRKQPVRSLVWAFFVGVFLTVFPIGRILGLLAWIAFGLLRPILLLLGLLKACEVIGERRK